MHLVSDDEDTKTVVGEEQADKRHKTEEGEVNKHRRASLQPREMFEAVLREAAI